MERERASNGGEADDTAVFLAHHASACRLWSLEAYAALRSAVRALCAAGSWEIENRNVTQKRASLRRALGPLQNGAHTSAVRAACASRRLRLGAGSLACLPRLAACFAPPRAALSRVRSAAWRRLKEVVYTLSNHNQNVMSGLWKDLPYKITKKVKENWLDNLFFLVPLVGTYQCVPVSRQPCAARVRVAAGGTVTRAENRKPACALRRRLAGLAAPARDAPRRWRPPAAGAGHAAAPAVVAAAHQTAGNPRLLGAANAGADARAPRQVRGELQGAGEAPPPVLKTRAGLSGDVPAAVRTRDFR